MLDQRERERERGRERQGERDWKRERDWERERETGRETGRERGRLGERETGREGQIQYFAVAWWAVKWDDYILHYCNASFRLLYMCLCVRVHVSVHVIVCRHMCL